MIQNATWIACGNDCETPVIRKAFTVEDPVSGVIEITGLGYFELYLNGKKVSEDLLVPALSDYHTRPLKNLSYPISDTFSHRIYYLRYEVTGYLIPGENKMEIILGNGWYRQWERIAEGELGFGQTLKAIFSLEVLEASGQKRLVQSDGTEEYTPTFITRSNLFLGEIQDARLWGAAESPRPVSVTSIPDTRLMLQTCPPDRVIRTIQPKLVHITDRCRIYDAGENISGWVKVRANRPAGDRITLRFAEELTAAGELDFTSTGSEYTCAGGEKQIQKDIFICNGEDFVFEPKFIFHTFRYFEMEGEADEITVAVVHSDTPVTSAFSSSSEALNWLYEAYLRTQLDNMHGGVPSDCPHRERLGYTGDGQATCECGMLLLDSKDFYEKWIGDILDCQDIHNGHVQHTAPFMGGGGGPGGWGCAVIVVPYRYYRNFGEKEILTRCYPGMKKWVGYMTAHTENGLITSEEPGGWCLGDWASLEPVGIPEPYVNTCYFVRALTMLAEIADVLGCPEEAAEYRSLIAKARDAVRAAYYEPETGSFCGGIQGADAFALEAGLDEDPRTLQNLCEKYRNLGHFDTGFLGTEILVRVLFRHGQADLAFSLLSTAEKGGYLWMKRQGATTIWEYMSGKKSHCHPMFGAPVQYLFSELLGIRQPEGTAGYERVIIAPQIPRGLDRAFGKVSTVRGEILVSWSRQAGEAAITVSIPQKVSARLEYGGREIPLKAGLQSFAFPEAI